MAKRKGTAPKKAKETVEKKAVTETPVVEEVNVSHVETPVAEETDGIMTSASTISEDIPVDVEVVDPAKMEEIVDEFQENSEKVDEVAEKLDELGKQDSVLITDIPDRRVHMMSMDMQKDGAYAGNPTITLRDDDDKDIVSKDNVVTEIPVSGTISTDVTEGNTTVTTAEVETRPSVELPVLPKESKPKPKRRKTIDEVYGNSWFGVFTA